MGSFSKWEQFLEEKNKVNADVPPQGKGAAPYHAPNAKPSGKVDVRVAEASGKKPLGDEKDPGLKSFKHNTPSGKLPENKKTKFQGKNHPDGQVRVRVAEKSSEKPFGDQGIPLMNNPKNVHTHGEKPSYKHLTTEEFLKSTADLSNQDFITSLLENKEKHNSRVSHEDLPPMRCQFSGKRVMPSAFEVSKYMAHMLPHNESAVGSFVNELKNVPGGLGALIGEMVHHDELYDEMVNQIGLGETKVARRFVKSMQGSHENFMSEMGLLTNSDNPFGEAVGAPMGDRTGETPHHHNPSKPAMFSDLPGDGTDSVDPIDAAGDTVDPQGLDVPESPKMKLRKEFAYHHMIKEMSGYDNMVDAMNETLGR